MTEKNIIKTSKFLSKVLRHNPGLIGLTINEEGWVLVSELIEKCKKFGKQINRENLDEVVEKNNKKRFAYDQSGTLIRASQGHSIKIELGYETLEPPKILYHGTAKQNINSIMKSGLIKGKRHHVHLSIDIDTALNVGKRHGKVVVFKVHTKQMYNDSYKFYCSENGVWLTDNVPTNYLEQINL